MALIKCPEPECARMVSDKAFICPECGFPVAAALKEQWEKSPEGIAALAEERRRERFRQEEQEEREREELAQKEELEKERKLQMFKDIRAKLD